MDIRKTIKSELKRRKLSVYQLVRLCNGRPSKNFMYRYLSGQQDMRGELLGRVLTVLKLDIKPRR